MLDQDFEDLVEQYAWERHVELVRRLRTHGVNARIPPPPKRKKRAVPAEALQRGGAHIRRGIGQVTRVY